LSKELDQILRRLGELLPGPAPATDWKASIAFRWRASARRGSGGWLQPVRQVHRIKLADLRGIDAQIAKVEQNTRQFLEGRPAKAELAPVPRGPPGEQRATHRRARHRQVLDREGPAQQVQQAGPAPNRGGEERPRRPPHIVDQVSGRKERFLLFCDDLSFHGAEDGYIALKVALDGSISTTSENMLIYATSNRRHLMPEYMAENLETKYVGDEIHPGETVEEKISLSERFGLWVTFYPFDQDEYLAIVGHWLKTLGSSLTDKSKEEALQWSLQRGSRSGRVAYQFARDWAGRHPKK
jgi:uncharacterized protein